MCKFCYKPVTQSDVDKSNSINISGSLSTLIYCHYTCWLADQNKEKLLVPKDYKLVLPERCCELGNYCVNCERELEQI